ncbi:hypothetical protein BJV82DRAFT_657706 [Fennellomyces sp. T-0311]|nr:hypothetical protein BJV82DRAFT_657706 [Fennellomyces sp. T-0311]
MKGQQESAIADTQRMIEYGSVKAVGYLRKGRILSLYGQQKQAIEVFDEALANTAPDNFLFKKLVNSKEAARNLNSVHIDLIAKLPVEIVNNILSQISRRTVVTCLNISKTWRQRMLECENSWKYLSIRDDPISIQCASIIPYTARHVKKLTIDSNLIGVRKLCFDHMMEGSFVNIESLKMSAMLSIALSTASRTLTSVDFDFSNNGNNEITLADLLLGCRAVTKLVYTTKSHMSAMIGDLSMAKSIIGSDIKTVLRSCQNIRRLALNKCNPTVIDIIKTCTTLEIFCYNYQYEVSGVQGKIDGGMLAGLRKIYIGNRIPLEHIMPLLYNNMKTLEVVNVVIPETTGYQVQQLYATYPDFSLIKLFDRDANLSESNQTLRSIKVRGCGHAVTDGVLASLARIKTLEDVHFGNVLAATAEGISNFLDATKHQLTSVYLGETELVKNHHLTALGAFGRLKKIGLRKLSGITDEGIQSMIKAGCPALNALEVIKCPAVTTQCISDAKIVGRVAVVLYKK